MDPKSFFFIFAAKNGLSTYLFAYLFGASVMESTLGAIWTPRRPLYSCSDLDDDERIGSVNLRRIPARNIINTVMDVSDSNRQSQAYPKEFSNYEKLSLGQLEPGNDARIPMMELPYPWPAVPGASLGPVRAIYKRSSVEVLGVIYHNKKMPFRWGLCRNCARGPVSEALRDAAKAWATEGSKSNHPSLNCYDNTCSGKMYRPFKKAKLKKRRILAMPDAAPVRDY
ncbi:hypothetical protein QBC39DRAFT_401350 [Podospora conica]|nr:hypothetical protein QBC39DRAFT_401350 [Schizothecium conicum]